MLHQSKFSLFAFLALLCAAVSGCSSTTASFLSSDPQVAEDILRESTDHQALVALSNQDTVICYSVAVRKDSTSWRFGNNGGNYAVPTDSVVSIEIPLSLSFFGALLGIPVGAVGGAVLGPILAIIYGGFKDIPGHAALGVILGIPVGAVLGAIDGWQLGAANSTVWTREPCKRTWDFINKQWVLTPTSWLPKRDTTQTKESHW